MLRATQVRGSAGGSVVSRGILNSFASVASPPLLGLIFAFVPAAEAETVGASFTAIVITVYENPSGPAISIGDLLRGHLVVDTSKAEIMAPGVPYANYAISGGAHISIYIGGKEFRRSIDYINVTNDRLIHTPDNLYLDRFFVSSDPTYVPEEGIQLWLDEESRGEVPNLLSSTDIPVPLSLDWSLATTTAWVLYTPEIRVAGWLTSFEALDARAMLQRLAADAAGLGPGKTLANKANLAQTYHATNDTQATCAVLTDFVDSVRRFVGLKKPKILYLDASRLIADGEAIKTAIGCS